MENELKPVKPDYLQAQSQTNPKQNNLPVWGTFDSLEAWAVTRNTDAQRQWQSRK